MPVKFTVMPDGSDKKSLIARKIRYMCPVTHDALTNTTRCAYLKTRCATFLSVYSQFERSWRRLREITGRKF
ncbi:unnamed protein product [Gongylonema pulchrum]|uniref:Rtf2 domain-containing protein n=1 Tax=Gongylonema pulchrum TaxID=637853 RepID=A0A183DNV6_9BILA|nr:unnamed protein product [Gongylonema pulchrum]